MVEVAPYLRLFAAQTRAQAQYRLSFWLDVLGSVVIGLLDLSAVVVLFQATGLVAGFTTAEAMLMATLATVGFATADLVVGNMDTIRNLVRTGRMDAVLLRPLGALGQLVATEFAPRRAGRLAVAVVLVPVAAAWSGVDWTPTGTALVLAASLGGALLFGAIFTGAGTVAFWWIESGEFSNSFTYGGRDFATYPITVYGPAFRNVFAFGLGLGFTGYYPALVLLGRSDPLGGPAWFGWLSLPVGLVACGAAALLWRAGVRRYRSTGS
ncbi:ABC-2 family transporter protein [Virgisporangium ochraceum]|uniref:ABC transporter permease n=1 Tax=Virgisporangium ochraceum TaxID=65505 RepID=A0A8J3ZWE8_9ACTN|nr:ABC-2 family transporter protein [Virgisporangium ochraceum]GIJ68735.1 ABC transporter permease [Virgisporangium ochraceum]